MGVSVKRYNFSEPQSGKDVCDRILCSMKGAIRRYCNEGHNILSAADMRTAREERPVQGCTAAVCRVNETKKDMEVKKFHQFRVRDWGSLVFQRQTAHQIPDPRIFL